MEVIGAGWGRTGTLSLKTALEILGLPCYHMIDVLFKHNDHGKVWLQAAHGKEVDFKQLLSGYKACVDWPSVTFYKQLMEIYPDAKVILSVRDPAKWYTSMKETVYQARMITHQAPWYVRLLSSVSGLGRNLDMVNKLIYETDLQGCFESDPEKAQQLFQEHIEEVKKVVPADRLLVFEVSQGWGPLCDFLGKPVPEQPFPHVNDTAGWKKQLAAMKRKNAVLSYTVPAVAAAILAAGCCAAQSCLRRQ